MNLQVIDASRCTRDEKEVIEGVCLSYDMVRDICLETMNSCDAVQNNPERPSTRQDPERA